MRRVAILAIVALSGLGNPALSHAAGDLATVAAQTPLDVSPAFDWVMFNLRLKLSFVLLIVAAIATLSHLAYKPERKPQADLGAAAAG
jgi:hypothetical protein